MKKFRINVNGNSYEVEVEEMGSVASSTPVSAPAPVTFVPAAVPAPVATPAPTKAPAAPAPATSGTAGNIKITAPMPGTILNIKVQVGDKVNSGDVVCILEAMKMENKLTKVRLY